MREGEAGLLAENYFYFHGSVSHWAGTMRWEWGVRRRYRRVPGHGENRRPLVGGPPCTPSFLPLLAQLTRRLAWQHRTWMKARRSRLIDTSINDLGWHATATRHACLSRNVPAYLIRDAEYLMLHLLPTDCGLGG